MPFKAELLVEDKIFAVRDFYLSLLRETTDKGQPNSNTSWILDVTIDAVNDTTITGWMLDPSKKIDGQVDIYKADGQGVMKSLIFEGANCFGMVDQFIPEFAETSCFIRIAGPAIDVGIAKFSSE